VKWYASFREKGFEWDWIKTAEFASVGYSCNADGVKVFSALFWHRSAKNEDPLSAGA